MQTPVEVDFQDLTATAEVRATIFRHVDELEERYGRLTVAASW
jgi:acyl-homoserine lactone acylase PvdQ